MSKYIIFHHNDLDGYMAGAVLFHGLTKYIKGLNKTNTRCYPCKFPTTIDQFHMDEIDDDTNVFIVDYSFTPSTLDILHSICKVAKHVVWLDHHISSMDSYQIIHGYKDIEITLDMNFSGAWLAWDYIWHNYMRESGVKYYVPEAVVLTDDYDRWVHKYNHSKYFNDGMYLEENFRRPWDKSLYYNLLFSVNNKNLLSLIINNGEVIHKYNSSRYLSKMSTIAYTRQINLGGKVYDAIICNSDGNSFVFGDELQNHDIGIVWQYNGKQKVYFCSIFTVKENIDCSEIAKAMGGGGHRQAAGFSCDHNVFS